MGPSLDVDTLFLNLGDDEWVVVDCRDEADWLRYPFRIPGALKMTPTEMEEWAHILPEDEQIILVGCAIDGDDLRRARAALVRSGRHPWWLRGGLRAWRRARLPIESVHTTGAEPGALSATA